MQKVTREEREASCMEGYLELDIANCPPSCILLLYPEKDIRAVRKYVEGAPLWRRAVADYYDINIAEAKEVLMCAMYGFPTPRNFMSPSPHTLPFVEWLAEDFKGARGKICRRIPDLMNRFAKNNRANADAAAFFYTVSQKGREILDLNFQKPDSRPQIRNVDRDSNINGGLARDDVGRGAMERRTSAWGGRYEGGGAP